MPIPSLLDLAELAWEHPVYMAHLALKKYHLARRYAWLRKNALKHGAVPLPLVYKLVLTWKCNLRCSRCMLWGESGWRKSCGNTDAQQELDMEVIEKVLSHTSPLKHSIILSGGEPFLYSRFPELIAKIKKKKCFTTICTNGTQLQNREELFIGNPYVTLLLSLDGPESENDLLRGKGVYNKVTNAIRSLKRRKNHPYIGVQFTVGKDNVGAMHRFCKEMIDLKVDWILINLQWFITPEEAREYETRFGSEFGGMPSSHKGYMLPAGLDSEEFVRQYSLINAEKWPVQISCYLKKPGDMRAYADSSLAAGAAFCGKQWVRMDVMPDGSITPCSQFPDLSVGNLKKSTIEEIWNCEKYLQFRDSVKEKLLPLCRKCDCLYLYDPNRKYL